MSDNTAEQKCQKQTNSKEHKSANFYSQKSPSLYMNINQSNKGEGDIYGESKTQRLGKDINKYMLWI